MKDFDNALPRLVVAVRNILGADTLGKGLFLRDAEGRLTFIARSAVSSDDRARFEIEAKKQLGPFVDGAFSTPDELFDESLKNDACAISETVKINATVSIYVKLIDRRIVGQDWDRPNFSKISENVPVVTFFSCKGGVGRSTALVLTATALSEQGKRVMIIDFDLEAPGLGPLLLNDDELPPYGLVDLLINDRLYNISDDELNLYIATSPLTAGRAIVEVVPAMGAIGKHFAENTIPKLGRVFLDSYDVEGNLVSFAKRAREIVKRLIDRNRTDIILVDARAGLSEGSAPAVLGFGGNVLMFGVDTPQTFECYFYLMKHLSRFVSDNSDDDWRFKIRMVHAKAARGDAAWAAFRERSYETFSNTLYDEVAGSSLNFFNYDIDDPLAPHYAWPIPFDLEYAEFDPRSKRTTLGRDFYERSFGPFINRLTELAFNESVDG